MANFQTHLGGAALGGGLIASSILATGMTTLPQAISGWLLVMLGGLLPDIDSNHSNVVRGLFSVFGGMIAILSIIILGADASIVMMWLAGTVSFIFVRYGLWYAFSRFTVHRGIFHSLLAGALFSLLAAALSYQLVELNSKVSWLMGICLFSGFVIHLLLDECYSVDLVNGRIKRSFGTAMKLFDYNNWLNSLWMLMAGVALLLLAPPWQDLWSLLTNMELLSSLRRQLW
ncbi:metal-dependent hydrolase [Oceanospirillum beijerinckii]|uniref:metal-dependent hydrolase n=1 Tax=Oceanospirillum beijerinckii TaxID=64976 RepID=UPI0004139845|nr:metal-dependent hydrolase [Oceanospirillum beijerinckii]MAC45374.1 hypothetical protein [Oceanospirillum sp.]